jgi:hypothetical protein
MSSSNVAVQYRSGTGPNDTMLALGVDENVLSASRMSQELVEESARSCGGVLLQVCLLAPTVNVLHACGVKSACISRNTSLTVRTMADSSHAQRLDPACRVLEPLD